MTTLYQRRRQLALVTAAASAFILATWLLFGEFPEAYSDPVILPAPGSLVIAHFALPLREERTVQRVLTVDPAASKVVSRSEYLDLSAVARIRGELIGFFGDRYRDLQKDGKLTRLEQDWPVEAAASDPAADVAWLFGVPRESILARPLQGDAAGPVEEVAKPEAAVENLQATFFSGGAVVAWKEKDRPGLRLARRGASRFERMADLSTGDAANWTIVGVGPRVLTIYFDRRDQSWSTLKLRVRCCRECGLPAPPEEWVFRDPFQLMARRVTGLSAAVDGARIRLAVTRAAAVQITDVPVATLAPEPGAHLASVVMVSAWRRYFSILLPSILLFLSFTLVYLGAALFRERRRATAAAAALLPPAAGVLYADFLQRGMAFVLDQTIVMTLTFVIAETLGVAPDSSEVEFSDWRVQTTLAIGYALNVAYFLAQEAWNGQTLGKRLTGIRVVNVGSDRLTLGRAVLRNVLRCFDAYNVFIVVGLLGVLFTRRRQRLGDLIAGTVVVQTSRTEPPA